LSRFLFYILILIFSAILNVVTTHKGHTPKLINLLICSFLTFTVMVRNGGLVIVINFKALWL